MNQSDFEKIVSSTITAIQYILKHKGDEYANSADRLANFKRGAELTGCTPLQVAFIYASKHYDAIASYVKNPNRQMTEPIGERLNDLINYCIFIKALSSELETSKFKPLGTSHAFNAADPWSSDES